jgi:hypothetical protein
MNERRFNEAEVAAIFQRASEAQHTTQAQLPSGQGLTLAELRQIAREVGISPELVEQASVAVERAGTPTSRKFLGLPIGVGRNIELGRKISDEEWERIVVDLRQTFDARGKVRQDGSLRQWTNGNLQALLEPTATGHQLRLKTLTGDAQAFMIAGASLVVVGAGGLIASLVQGATGDVGALSALGSSLLWGAGFFAAGSLRLPSWARKREKQMREIAERLATPPASATAVPRIPEDL